MLFVIQERIIVIPIAFDANLNLGENHFIAVLKEKKERTPALGDAHQCLRSRQR